MIAILNHMPLWAGLAMAAAVVLGLLIGKFLVYLQDRDYDRD